MGKNAQFRIGKTALSYGKPSQKNVTQQIVYVTKGYSNWLIDNWIQESSNHHRTSDQTRKTGLVRNFFLSGVNYLKGLCWRYWHLYSTISLRQLNVSKNFQLLPLQVHHIRWMQKNTMHNIAAIQKSQQNIWKAGVLIYNFLLAPIINPILAFYTALWRVIIRIFGYVITIMHLIA